MLATIIMSTLRENRVSIGRIIPARAASSIPAFEQVIDPELRHDGEARSGRSRAKRLRFTADYGQQKGPDMHRTTGVNVCVLLVMLGLAAGQATAQPMSKAQVANLITKVENGVDEFRDYLEKRGENARDANSAAQSSGRRKGQSATENQKAKANSKKDALDDALGDLNKSTNRLRRKFDATDKWIETKGQVESVVEDAKKINPLVARGNYGADAARLWAALRTGINDLARAYGVPPLAI
jgi:hypothetical protein